ncbi:thiamine diphosphokinase [Puniceicoccales bacterium CK1056]|uniref:Thiamine diphosphokinase n=1 Tax=Oceanipulchritudo coccoides TaxID=2706888 RepID=A0A6B2LXJ0_9BACT|nr:thiamine diphosphokinase [Oceanipulchritudo coccoides]NDV61311.1 thiamine diphosphokinase [Oceanipulchritudo coccoides]
MRTLIFLGGEKPSPPLSRAAAGRADFIIAADSGYLPALECGITPDIVTGDFDSIGEPPSNESIKVIPAPEQDATDFQKALRHIPAGSSIVEILGGTGLRSDHFLTNLLIAAGLPAGQFVIFEDDTQTIFRVTPECPLSASLQEESVVSLIPFTDCSGVTTQGLHWNLQSSRMGPRHQLGQSNRVTDSTVKIQLEEGILYVVVNDTVA